LLTGNKNELEKAKDFLKKLEPLLKSYKDKCGNELGHLKISTVKEVEYKEILLDNYITHIRFKPGDKEKFK
jgi:hypothetical protein